MSLKNWSTTPGSNTSSPPNGAPESTTTLADVNDIMRQMMADVRTLAAADTIAAASTTDIGSKDNTIITLTGTATTITALGTVSAGIYKFIIYNAAHSLTHNATSLILLGGASKTVAAGNVSLFVSEGSGNWRELMYSTGTGYQPLDATLTALASALTAANKIPYATATDTLGELDLDTDGTLAANSDTKLASQKAVKTYADGKVSKTVTGTLTVGYTSTVYDNGTKSSGTLTLSEANGGLQKVTNGGAFTLAPPTNDTSILLKVINNATAGAITTSSFTKVSGSFTTTNGNKFLCSVSKVDGDSLLSIQALQ